MSTSVFQSVSLGGSGPGGATASHCNPSRRQSFGDEVSAGPNSTHGTSQVLKSNNHYNGSQLGFEGESQHLRLLNHQRHRREADDQMQHGHIHHNSPPGGSAAAAAGASARSSAKTYPATSGIVASAHPVGQALLGGPPKYANSDCPLPNLLRQHRSPSYDSSMSTQSFEHGGGGMPHSSHVAHVGSFGLTHQRRHAASMTAALRGSGSDSAGLMSSDEARSGFRSRAASWAVESPKKLRATRGGGVSDAARKVCGSTLGIESPWSNWIIRQLLYRSRFLNRRAVKDNRREFLGWVLLVGLIVIGYKFFSDGSFSAILTLASAFQCFALALLLTKVLVQQSVAGVSQRSLVLIATCLTCRLASTVFYNGYLPVDRSGDWIYQLADAFTVFLTLALLLYARWYCRTSVQSQEDKDTCFIGLPVAVVVVFAILVHPSLNQNVLADISWTAGLYIETLAMIPQLFMMSKLPGEVEAVTSHYVASMAASKVFAFLFWYFSYTELAPRNGGRNTAGYAVVFSYFIQVVLFLDFLYYYIKSLKVGKGMIINF